MKELRHNILKGLNHQQHHCENLKSHKAWKAYSILLCTKVNIFCGHMTTGGVDGESGKYLVTQGVHSVIFIGVKGSAHGNTESTKHAEIKAL